MVSVEHVAYEFQRGGNEMLRIMRERNKAGSAEAQS
jgi:hypothetical protein